MDGGDIKLVEIENGIVYLKLQGPCVECPFTELMVKFGIERAMKEEIPGIRGVQAIAPAQPEP